MICDTPPVKPSASPNSSLPTISAINGDTVNEQKFLATMKSSYTQAKRAHGLLTIMVIV